MRVVHVITTLDMGGAENQLLLLASEQKKKGIDVVIVPLKGKLELAKEFESGGIQVIRSVINKRFTAQVLRFRRYIRDLKFDSNLVIHAHLPQAELLCTFSLPKKIPFLVTRHFGGQFYPNRSKRISRMLALICSSRAVTVIAISRSVAEMLVNTKEVKTPDKISIIYYGFSTERFKEEENEIHFTDTSNLEVFRIGTVARLSSEKDVVTLLDAFSLLIKKENNISLHIVGDGPLREVLERRAIDLKINNFVEWLGRKKEILQFIKSLNIFVLTSKFEGFGMVLLEAMYAGVPIVCAKNSAMIEVLGEEGAGIFFETSNPNDLYNRLLEMDTIDLAKMRKLQKKQLASFSIVNTANAHEEIYNQVLSSFSF